MLSSSIHFEMESIKEQDQIDIHAPPAKRQKTRNAITLPPESRIHESAEVMMTDTISIDGDVILIVGPSRVRYRVLSTYLVHTSSTFKAMLSDRFSEGQHPRSATSPKEIYLPDDDSKGMRILMNILHLQNGSVPVRLANEDDFILIAKLVDKYDLSNAVKCAGYPWFQQFEQASLDGCIKLTAVAYLMKDPLWFRRYTRALVTLHEWDVATLFDKFEKQSIPHHALLRLILSLDRHRTASFLLLEERIDSFCKDTCEGAHYYSIVLDRIKRYLDEKRDRTAFPGCKSVLLKTVFDQLRAFDHTKDARLRGNWAPDFKEKLLSTISKVDEACRGLCLICLRDGHVESENCIVAEHG